MIRVGEPPYLECSSKGDKRFSAFYARPSSLMGLSIEEAYQGMKVFENGRTNLHWTEAKGQRARNHVECADAYLRWWCEWVIQQNLMPVLQAASGLSDVFGKPNHVCQASTLWEIRNA